MTYQLQLNYIKLFKYFYCVRIVFLQQIFFPVFFTSVAHALRINNNSMTGSYDGLLRMDGLLRNRMLVQILNQWSYTCHLILE